MTCGAPYDRADFNPNKDECKKCERLTLGQASERRSARREKEREEERAKKAELERVLAARRSEYIKELEAALKKAQKALQEDESK